MSTIAWTLEGTRHANASVPGPKQVGPIPAKLPGCVHSALVRTGVIGDPRVNTNELEQQWVGHMNWTYRGEFPVDSTIIGQPDIDLLIDGLDTLATISLNGQRIGAGTNEYRPWRLNVRDALRRGSNELVISFEAPLPAIRNLEQLLGTRPVNGDWDPFIFMRKRACNFGWDWGPKVPTCGIWESIALDAGPVAKIESMAVLVRRAEGASWEVELRCEVAGAGAGTHVIAATLAGDGNLSLSRELVASVKVTASSTTCCTLHVENPKLWWPARHGDAPLYRLHVGLFDSKTGESVDTRDADIGFRTVSLDTELDTHGRAFTIKVNERPIFCVGVNWIPHVLLPGLNRTDDRARMITLLDRVRDAGFNMIRVWGGGQYECREFYEYCDRHGILVWQDFMFACAMYPEEAPFPAEIESEAAHHIRRLSPHPSLALWCGGNECIWGYESWGWKQRLAAGQSWGREYYLSTLPRLVQQIDPTRPYWANSPWSGVEGMFPNDAMHGDRHTWDVKIDGYAITPTRFCSEFGHQSPSALATLGSVMSESDLAINSAALAHRQRGPGGNKQQYDDPLGEWFSPPANFWEWHYLAQLLQARAMRIGIESCRAFSPVCMGALVWQLNDVWPGLTWSLIDDEGVPKLAYWASVEAATPRLMTFQPRGEGVSLILVNDSDEPWDVHIMLRRLHLTNGEVASSQIWARVAGRGVETLDVAELVGAAGDGEYLAAGEAVWFGPRDRELSYPTPKIKVQGGRVRAVTLIRDLCPADPDVSPPPGRHWPLTLLPGDEVELAGLAAGTLDRDEWYCANWFGRSTAF